MIGQEHAKEVEKWQALANYAGNELKHLGLTVTAGVQINQSLGQLSYSIVNVQLNRDALHNEIDLLSPKFAEKFACGIKCERLGLYDSNFAEQKTQLASFFYEEEGRFFEFYGRLTRLNVLLADYRASSPEILKKYLTLLLNRKLVFDSLADFFDYLEVHINEEKLIVFSKSGFMSPEENKLTPQFSNDVIANLPSEWQINEEIVADDNLQSADTEMPDNNWNINSSTADELLFAKIAGTTSMSPIVNVTFEQAKQHNIKLGSLVCSFSDNSFGIVKKLNANQATLKVIGQARIDLDGMKLYPQPGYLFSAADSFYFVKGSSKETYPRSDIASCNIEHLKRGQKFNSSKEKLAILDR